MSPPSAASRFLPLALAAAAFVLMASPAAAVQPIEGTWFYSGGEVLVEPTGPGTFKGTVVKPTTFSSCTHQNGEVMWQISGGGDSYTGTHNYFNNSDCSSNPGGKSTWRVRQEADKFFLDFCSAPPGQGDPTPDNPQTDCNTLNRAKAPTAPTTACASGQEVCAEGPAELRTQGCLRRGAFAHRFRVGLKKRTRGGNLVNRRSRVQIVRFTLDGRANGTDRRRPFYTTVKGSTLTIGAHVLKADVRLRVPNTNKRFRKRITFKFNGCS